MADTSGNITSLSDEHGVFIHETPLMPIFGFIRVRVPTGQKWLVYRDGLLVKQLEAGPHSWWNGFLHKWEAQVINTHVELFPITVQGHVKGPSGPKEKDGQGTNSVELACEVTTELELSVKIVEVENFIQYRDPLSVFKASIENMVIEFIGQLPYDQYGQWATVLRDLVRDRLQGRSQGGRDNSERRVGIRVEDVFVTEFKPSPTSDRTTFQMYQMVERARRELVEAQENAKRDKIVAGSLAEQAAILNVAPSILALQNSPIGKVLIERDADLQGLMVHAGLHPGINITMQNSADPSALSGPLARSVGYLKAPSTTAPLSAISGSLQGEQVTGELLPAGSTPPALASSFTTDEHPIDATRQQKELAALQQGGFQPAGSGQVAPRYNEQGQPIAGSKEWVLQVTQQSSYLTIFFYCSSSYPANPPRVYVKAPGGGNRPVPMEPNSVVNWHPGRMLLDIAQEISQIPRMA